SAKRVQSPFHLQWARRRPQGGPRTRRGRRRTPEGWRARTSGTWPKPTAPAAPWSEHHDGAYRQVHDRRIVGAEPLAREVDDVAVVRVGDTRRDRDAPLSDRL